MSELERLHYNEVLVSLEQVATEMLVGTENEHHSFQSIQSRKKTFIPELKIYRKCMCSSIKDLVLGEASQSDKSLENIFVI